MSLTHFLARAIGLFCLVFAASMIFRKKVVVEVIKELRKDRALLYIIGNISLILGLLIVLVHNIWNDGLLALVVTVIGWALVLRGVVAMFVQDKTVKKAVRLARIEEYPEMYALIFVFIGAYLTAAGFAG